MERSKGSRGDRDNMRAGGETACRLPCTPASHTHLDHADMQGVSHSRRKMSLNHENSGGWQTTRVADMIQLWI